MKTPEDEAFDDLAQRQGHWGGGYQAKREAALDKLVQEQERLGLYDPPPQPAQEPTNYLHAVLNAYGPDAGISLDQKSWSKLHAAIKAALAQPAQKPVAWLTNDERKALERFTETCDDGEGYDVPKQMMQRLAQIGVVNHTSGGVYSTTEFGRWVIDAAPPQRERVVFPTMLRKMWSGGEVQAWLDENVNKERRQGGGFPAKRAMAADKMQEDQVKYGTSWSKDGERIDPMSVYNEPAKEPMSFPCCGYTDANAIRWNQFNGVVQCHMCGQVYTVAQPAQEPHEYDWSMLEAAKESLREHMARIKELEAALAQPAQEPVACSECNGMGFMDGYGNKCSHCKGFGYTTPPQPAQEPVTMEDAVAAGDSVLMNEQAGLLRRCRMALDDLLRDKPMLAAKLCGTTTLGNLRAELHEYRPSGVFGIKEKNT